MDQANQLRTGDYKADIEKPELCSLNILVDKLRDEIVSRLAELAEEKIGRLTFYFAQQKLSKFESEVKAFARFVESNRFREKRNYDISHKELPEQWTDHKHIHIPDFTVLKGVALALRLMKRIDRSVLGPSAPYPLERDAQKTLRTNEPGEVWIPSSTVFPPFGSAAN